jgi:hypothetical protein
LVILFSLLLVGCGNNESKNVGKYEPKINPNPKYFMNVKLTSRFPLKVNVRAIFSTTKKKCEIDVSGGEGAMYPRSKLNEYELVLGGKGQRAINIPLDEVSSGYCGWKLTDITYGLQYNEQKIPQIMIGYFSSEMNNKRQQTGYDKWHCNKKQCKLTKSVALDTNSRSNLPISNYVFSIKFL